MENPFKTIDARLRNIENILLDIRYPSREMESRLDKNTTKAPCNNTIDVTRTGINAKEKGGNNDK